jgi:CubicO group peptidase (beta-lactamase class C family)
MGRYGSGKNGLVVVRQVFKRLLLLWFAIVLVAACTPATPSPAPAVTPVSSVYWPTDGWRSSTPEEQGMDSVMLADMLSAVHDKNYSIDSVSVIRNGYMVVDATVHPFRPNTKHIIHSCTKSIVSILVGIAIEKGYIDGVGQPILSLFPDKTAANLDESKQAVTLEDFLTMSTGMNCQDSYLYRWQGLNQMRTSEDWVQFVLDLEMVEEPGTRFEYCNGASYVLSAGIQESTGMSTLEFSEKHLFGPLGISNVSWPYSPEGINIGWGELRMLPHDMAKIGYLYLNNGLWDGEQIVSSAWVAESTREHISATLEDGYGYQWWVDDSGIYMALGYAGQFIFVIPDKDMVVVFTSNLGERDFYVPQTLLTEFIIPAAVSSTPLPENPEGTALLVSHTADLSNP